jgi:hypothetical protein
MSILACTTACRLQTVTPVISDPAANQSGGMQQPAASSQQACLPAYLLPLLHALAPISAAPPGQQLNKGNTAYMRNGSMSANLDSRQQLLGCVSTDQVACNTHKWGAGSGMIDASQARGGVHGQVVARLWHIWASMDTAWCCC